VGSLATGGKLCPHVIGVGRYTFDLPIVARDSKLVFKINQLSAISLQASRYALQACQNISSQFLDPQT